MQDLVKIARLLIGTTITTVVMVVIIFASVLVYHTNPSAVTTKKLSAENWKPKDIDQDLPEGRRGKLIKYGYLLVSENSHWIGPFLWPLGRSLSCRTAQIRSLSPYY